MKKISIIIPIYNAEKYIEDTLKAVVEQTIFTDLEVILINDGSTDNTCDICAEFAEKYANIILINQDNTGVSVARNTGLKYATSNYITFLDADDYIEKKLYEKELELIETYKADVACVDFVKVHSDGKTVKYRNNFIAEWKESYSILTNFFSGVIGNQVVDKIFSKRVLEDIEFYNKYKIGEDMLFVYEALKKARAVVMDTNICGYHYVVRDNSAMTGDFDAKYFDPVKVSQKMVEDTKTDETLNDYAQAHLIHEICKSLEYIYRKKAQSKCVCEVNKLKQVIKKYSIEKAKKYLVKKQFYGFLLMKLSPKAYLFVHKVMHVG